VYRDERYGAGILYAEWPAGESAPAVEVTTRFTTRDRMVDVTRPGGSPAPEDRAALAKYRESSRLVRTDGIVKKTSQQITKGIDNDVEKARAIYEWIVDNTFRDPKVRAKLFGQWEMNWLAYNYAHDVKLVSSKDEPVAFLMYPRPRPGRAERTASTRTPSGTRSPRVSSAPDRPRHLLTGAPGRRPSLHRPSLSARASPLSGGSRYPRFTRASSFRNPARAPCTP